MAICNICGNEFTGFGNNAWPIRTGDGECCNDCNYKFVVPGRLVLSRRPNNTDHEFAKILNTKTLHQLEVLFDVD